MADDICLERRLERDVRERGRTPESVVEQFRTTVAPMAERYVRPTRVQADVVIFGAIPMGDQVERVLEHVRRNDRGSFADLYETDLHSGGHSRRIHKVTEKIRN
jgi:hypothetical protein